MAGWEDFTAALVAGMVPRAVVAGMGPPVAGMVARVGAGVIPALVGDIPAGVVDGVGEADGGSVSVSTLVGVGPPIRMHTAIRTTTLTILTTIHTTDLIITRHHPRLRVPDRETRGPLATTRGSSKTPMLPRHHSLPTTVLQPLKLLRHRLGTRITELWQL